jgi:hypothetical protein
MSSQTLSPDTLQPPPLSSQLYAWYPDWPSPNLCLHKPELAALIPLPNGELLDTSSLPHFSPQHMHFTHLRMSCLSNSPMIRLDPPSSNLSLLQALTSPQASKLAMIRLSQRLQITHLLAGNPISRLPRWRSRLKHAYILSLADVDIPDHATLVRIIASLRCTPHDQDQLPVVSLKLTFDDAINTLSSSGLPLLYFDQLRQIRQHTHALRHTHHLPTTTPVAHRLTRRGLQTQPGWSDWLQSEAEQLDSYATQGMFGAPCAPPPKLPSSTGFGSTRSKPRTTIARKHALSATDLRAEAMP